MTDTCAVYIAYSQLDMLTQCIYCYYIFICVEIDRISTVCAIYT